MSEYRFYKVSADGCVCGPPHVVVCSGDMEAVKEAEKVLDDHDIEIWKGKNVVSHLISQDAKK